MKILFSDNAVQANLDVTVEMEAMPRVGEKIFFDIEDLPQEFVAVYAFKAGDLWEFEVNEVCHWINRDYDMNLRHTIKVYVTLTDIM